MIVMKFGGTSVESYEAIERVTAIVKSNLARRPIVVVSAMGKTTNKLLNLAIEAAGGRRDQALSIVDEIRAHHLTAGLALAGAAAADLDRYIRSHFEWLEELVKGLSIVGELSPRSMDAIASVGERLSSLVVSYAFRTAGMPTQHVDARRVIITDDQFTHAQPIFEDTYPLLEERVASLANDYVVVMGGYIGSTRDGQTTTLGRGGSDYSASIVGAGVDAEEIQIWTDVDGMLTTDPRIVPGGHRVKHITFAEAAELAYFGAKVLHPATVVPAIEKNIPVSILNSRRPEVGGTRISAATRTLPQSGEVDFMQSAISRAEYPTLRGCCWHTDFCGEFLKCSTAIRPASIWFQHRRSAFRLQWTMPTAWKKFAENCASLPKSVRNRGRRSSVWWVELSGTRPGGGQGFQVFAIKTSG